MNEQRTPLIESVRNLGVPKSMISRACQLPNARITDFVQYKSLPAHTEKRIADVISKILFVWQTVSPFKVILDSPKLLEDGFARASRIERDLRDLQELQEQLEQRNS